jgi:transposase-like protein
MQLQAQAGQIACPRCGAPMLRLDLSTRSSRSVQIDLCKSCRLVWFDALESVQLDGLGWVGLLRAMQQGDPEGLPPPRTDRLACPVCARDLKTVHNATRFGRFQSFECPQRHGHLQSRTGLLAERGLVRPLLGPERRALAEERHRIDCLNCGAPSDGRGESCSYCGSPFVVVDLPRIGQALRLGLRSAMSRPSSPETLLAQAATTIGRPVAWACRACGEALDPSRDPNCPRCGHLVVAPALADLAPLLDAAERELRADAADRAARPVRPRVRSRRHWQATGLGALARLFWADGDEPPLPGLPSGRALVRSLAGAWVPVVLALLALLAWSWLA